VTLTRLDRIGTPLDEIDAQIKSVGEH
jgi:hypothetical protein